MVHHVSQDGFGFVGSDAKLAACSALVGGGIHCINYKEKNFADEVLAMTQGTGDYTGLIK